MFKQVIAGNNEQCPGLAPDVELVIFKVFTSSQSFHSLTSHLLAYLTLSRTLAALRVLHIVVLGRLQFRSVQQH